MKKFLLYLVIAGATVWLAFSEAGQPMGISGFLAIFVCQPWLAVIWTLTAMGVPIPDKSLSPGIVALMAALNVLVWGTWLILSSRRRIASQVEAETDAS